jgi:hypothetical protein
VGAGLFTGFLDVEGHLGFGGSALITKLQGTLSSARKAVYFVSEEHQNQHSTFNLTKLSLDSREIAETFKHYIKILLLSYS